MTLGCYLQLISLLYLIIPLYRVKINGISMVHSKLQIRSPNPLDKMINVELIAVDKVGDHVVETTTFQGKHYKNVHIHSIPY